jgi:hypothetical protein
MNITLVKRLADPVRAAARQPTPTASRPLVKS